MNREEAIERIKTRFDKWALDNEDTKAIQTLIPELRESEDERIRKEIIDFLKVNGGIVIPKEWIAWLEKQKDNKFAPQVLPCSAAWFEDGEEKQKEQDSEDEEDSDFTIYHPLKNGKGEYECIPYSFYGSLTSFSEDKDLIDFLRTCFYTEEECNEWIEKQKEQKPTPDWMPRFLDELRSKKNYFDWDEHRDIEGQILAIINWIDPNYFKQKEKEQKPVAPTNVPPIPSRNIVQKPAEWSEEDEERIQRIHDFMWKNRKGDTDTIYQIEKDADWLKSLRPDSYKNCNSRWKPSEAQMKALQSAIVFKEIRKASDDDITPLKSLYEQLKAL